MRVAEGIRRVADYEPRLGQPFDLQGELDAKLAELSAIDKALAESEEAVDAEEDGFGEIFGPIGANAINGDADLSESGNEDDLAA